MGAADSLQLRPKAAVFSWAGSGRPGFQPTALTARGPGWCPLVENPGGFLMAAKAGRPSRRASRPSKGPAWDYKGSAGFEAGPASRAPPWRPSPSSSRAAQLRKHKIARRPAAKVTKRRKAVRAGRAGVPMRWRVDHAVLPPAT